ncbi:MAG: hypothetical protein ACLT33_06585 [Lachnospira pectinoschiza]
MYILNAPVANAVHLEETATGGSGSDTQAASDKSVSLHGQRITIRKCIMG